MTFRVRSTAILVSAALLAPVTPAQDSTQITPGGPGDAVFPWSDASGLFDPFGSEQRNDYVVDMDRLTTSWGTPFGVAPIVKSSKSNSGFNNSLLDAQAISRLQKTNVSTFASSYQVWSGAGFGVNNDPSKNTATGTTSTTTATSQFTVAFNEGGETDAGDPFFYDGVVGAIVNFVPSMPGRLYVSRINAASNSCFPTANLGSVAMGSVDEDGNVFFRYDGFGGAGGCGLSPASNDNIGSVKMTVRDASIINVAIGTPMTLVDVAATSTYIFGSTTVHSTPSNIPESIASSPTYGGLTFAGTYVSGTAGSTSATAGFLDAGTNGSRGNLSYSSKNITALANSAGAFGNLGKSVSSGGANTNSLNIFGVNAAGAVTGTISADMPATITDNSTSFVSLSGIGTAIEFDHYTSQVAFGGGNGQVALGTDQAGNLLAAATFDMPADSSSADPVNAIAVAKFNSTTGGLIGWTLAAYNNFPGVAGKPVLDGPGGATVYEMATIGELTGDPSDGPSMSSPAMDSVGNLYFLATVKEVATGDFDVGLIRAVYDPGTFSYELEMVLRTGDEFEGQNSGVDYLVSFIDLIDDNSIDSGAFWSSNVSEVAHGGMSTAGLETRDPRTNGGVILAANIIYDVDDDGSYDGPGFGVDEPYNVLLYIGHREMMDVGFAKPRAGGEVPKLTLDGTLIPGNRVGFNFTNAEPGQQAYTILGFSGVYAPFKCTGTLVPSTDVIFKPFPTFGGDFGFDITWPGPPLVSGIDLHWQVWFTGPSECGNFSSTNGVVSRTH